MSRRSRWLRVPTPPGARELLEPLGLPGPVAEVLAQRVGTDLETARSHLEARLPEPGRFLELPGASSLLERLLAARYRSERVAIFGDYDADGISATALIAASLERLGCPTTCRLPNRFQEGYGLKPAHIEWAAASGASVLLALDCGSRDLEAARAALARGVDLLILDHHRVGSEIPPALAFVNPALPNTPALLRGLTSAGLASLLAAALFERCQRPVPWSSLLRLASIGTIADIAPLVGFNRVLVRQGLEALATVQSPGLRTLARFLSGESAWDVRKVAFGLAPRLNAPGRLATPDVALELLLTRDPNRAWQLATELDRLNRERQNLELETYRQARERLPRGEVPRILVLSDPGWHKGVLGIAAARLARELHRPVVLLAGDGPFATGSGRSIPGLSLHDWLLPWADRLEAFGGHDAAVGLTVATDRLPELVAEWNEAACSWPESLLERTCDYHLEVDFEELDAVWFEAFDVLEPFGPGFPEPIIRTSLPSGFDPWTPLGSSRFRTFVRTPLVEIVAGRDWNPQELPSPDLATEVLLRRRRQLKRRHPTFDLVDSRSPVL